VIRAPARAALDVAVLVLLGGVAVWLTLWLEAELDPGDFGRRQSVLAGVTLAVLLPYAAAGGWVLLRRPPRRALLVVVLAVAAILRLSIALGEPVLSNDVFRYVWDGRVQAHGINPYLHPPSDPALSAVRDDEIYPRLNRPEVRTAYPPVAEGLFLGLYRLHPDSVPWTKLAFALLDLAAVGLLAFLLLRLGRPPELALLYGWHPLAVFEIAGTGHVEGVAVLLVLVSILAALTHRTLLTGVLLAAATLVKPYALVLAPALMKGGRDLVRGGIALGVTVAIAYLPYANAGRHALGYAPDYLREEGFTSGDRFYLLGLLDPDPSAFATAAYLALATGILLGLAAAFLRTPPTSPRAIPTRALWMFVTLFVLVSPTYPWYALLAVALLPLAEGFVRLPAAAISLLAPFLYLHISVGLHPAWPRHLVYGGSTLALAAAAWVVAVPNGVVRVRTRRLLLRS
jgi:alpha-1,6-mannosyltransferase